jgi:Multicopper oxidase
VARRAGAEVGSFERGLNDDAPPRAPRTAAEPFATETAGPTDSAGAQVIDLADGDTVELWIAPVAKQIGDTRVRMLAFNGSVPGPTLRVREGSELVARRRHEGDREATVHWYGLRLDNRYDGMHETQAPIPVDAQLRRRAGERVTTAEVGPVAQPGPHGGRPRYRSAGALTTIGKVADDGERRRRARGENRRGDGCQHERVGRGDRRVGAC